MLRRFSLRGGLEQSKSPSKRGYPKQWGGVPRFLSSFRGMWEIRPRPHRVSLLSHPMASTGMLAPSFNRLLLAAAFLTDDGVASASADSPHVNFQARSFITRASAPAVTRQQIAPRPPTFLPWMRSRPTDLAWTAHRHVSTPASELRKGKHTYPFPVSVIVRFCMFPHPLLPSSSAIHLLCELRSR